MRTARAVSKLGLRLNDFDRDALARQRAGDEHDLAVGVRDAAAFLVERFDVDGDRHGMSGGADCTRAAARRGSKR